MTERHLSPTVQIWCAMINPGLYFARIEGVEIQTFTLLTKALEWVYKTLRELHLLEDDAALNAVLLAMHELKHQSSGDGRSIGEALQAADWLYGLHPEGQVSDDTPAPQADARQLNRAP